MKQSYKDLLINYLSDKPGLEVKCSPGSWWRKDLSVDGKSFSFNDRIWSFIKLEGNNLENALICRRINDEIRNGYTSFKLTYNTENQEFTGEIKHPIESHDTINVDLAIPDGVIFNNMRVTVVVKSKKTVECNVTLNIRNGILPANKEEVEKNLSRALSNAILSKMCGMDGRVSGRNWNVTINYSKTVTIPIRVIKLKHSKESITIKL